MLKKVLFFVTLPLTLSASHPNPKLLLLLLENLREYLALLADGPNAWDVGFC